MTSTTIPTGTYVIVRATNAGVFAGRLAGQDGQTVLLTDARRLWYWDGAASLSDLAVNGTSAPAACKFPPPVGLIQVAEVIEVIPTTAKAQTSIEAVPAWTRH